ncbi:hypothetical protein [Okeania sp. SIO2B3]|uniref:hypothetical protein n=1 Tax=Okeania sp. SIO2B3 TaxID=2607784 RepID=UPI0013C28D33|nr:hypothetical protein [Okeania sp. SIO2B3]NET42097.1 hypothetical protein [Okeania sp. SIO2B3]
MPLLEREFLDYISKKIFPGNAPPELQHWTFTERFYPNNYSLKNTEIAKGLEKMQGKYNPSGINQHIKEVIEKIYREFQDELAQDGITEEKLNLGNYKGKPGRKTSSTARPWEIIYEWLWNQKYYRWLPDYIWENWKQKAQTNLDWIQFCPHSEDYSSKGMKIPPALPKESLPINTPLNLKINLDTPGSYLLLFNRGRDSQGNITKYLVTPSKAFAPSYQIVEKTTSIPLQNAICKDIQFDTVSTEEYIGIVINNPLDLPWLNPDSHNPIVEWEGKELEQVWEQLRSQDNWQVFYQNFDVISFNNG